MDILRSCVFSPYRKGMGPKFTLRTWDTGRTDKYGKTCIGYELRMSAKLGTVKLFSGEDFYCSPMHADDSDETVRSLMNFLTLRPGDTDEDYFAGYTAEQLAFCDEHAESLAMEVMNRFGEES